MAIHKGKLRQRNSGGTYDYLLPETTIDMVNGLQDELDGMYGDIVSRGINVKYPPAPFTGVNLDGVTDDSDIINTLINNFDVLFFPSGRYAINKQLNFKHGQEINAVGNVIFDGSNFTKVNGGAVIKVSNTGSNYTTLPTPTNSISKYDTIISFTSNHNLSVGDIICLYDNTDFSYSSGRNYYRKGEFSRVVKVENSTTILLSNPIFDNYTLPNANLGLYKMNMGKFNINGNLEIINGLNDSQSYGIKLDRVCDFVSNSNLKVVAKGCYAGICFEQCYNINFNGVSEQFGESGSDTDYGLAIVNCQHINVNGYFVSSRHAITNTCKNEICSIVNRDCKYFGTVKSLGTSQVATCAFDAHGNCDNIQFTGTAYGGINLGGSNMKVSGIIYGNKYGVCVYGNDLKSFNHDFSGCKFITNLNPNDNSRGVFDIGNNSTADINQVEGGILNLNNVELNAPNARFGLVVRTRNINSKAGEKIDISLVGSNIYVGKGVINDCVAIRVEMANGATPFRLINGSGSMYYADRNIVPGTVQYIPSTLVN